MKLILLPLIQAILIEKTKKGYSLIKIRSYPSPIGKDTKLAILPN